MSSFRWSHFGRWRFHFIRDCSFQAGRSQNIFFTFQLSMGTTLEIWRARVGNWNAAGRRSSTKKKAGVGTLLVKVLMSSVSQLFVALSVLSISNGMTKLDNRKGQATTRCVVFLTRIAGTILASALSLSAKTAEVASKLMHDVETNPGPNCSGVSSFLSSVRSSLHYDVSY